MENAIKVDYYATDISQQMLLQSNIPAEKQYHGTLNTINLPEKKFDFIFLLGVSSYFDKKALLETATWAHQHLTKDGQLIISFTNSQSLDVKMRWLLRPFFKALKTGLLAQNFETKHYSLPQVLAIFPDQLTASKISYFNFTITPFNQLFPKLSVIFAQFFEQKLMQSKTEKYLAADFIVHWLKE